MPMNICYYSMGIEYWHIMPTMVGMQKATFKEDAMRKSQAMSYCGTGHHSQNGIAEQPIKSLSENSRSMLAHGMDL